MTVGQAFSNGAGRVRRAPAVVAGLWIATIVVAWPLALSLRGALAQHLGASLAAETAASGVNHDWWNEFLAQAQGLGQTFVPAVLGFAAVLENLSAVADAEPVSPVIAAVVAGHLLTTIFLTGGVIDRLARDRRTGTYGFFAACGTYFFRMARLSLVAGAVYWTLFAWMHPLLFDRLFPSLVRDLTQERLAMVYRALLYLVFLGVLTLVNVLVDYAKIRMVVEDRRSALGSLAAAARFLRRHASAVAALYALNTVVFVALLAVYALVAPGAGGGSAAWAGFFVGQLYIAGRIAARLLFTASQVSLFQGRLAHARYTASPLRTWPESAAAEAISPS